MKGIKPSTLVCSAIVLLSILAALFFRLGSQSWPANREIEPIAGVKLKKTQSNHLNEKSDFVIPSFADIPDDQVGKSIRRGKKYLENTFETLPRFVGAKMNCTNCHLNSGTTQFAGPWIGVAARFPQYRSRSAKVDSLVDRVNDCFERSLNGKRLPENSEPMTDIISYMTWLSKGYPIGGDVEGSGMAKDC